MEKFILAIKSKKVELTRKKNCTTFKTLEITKHYILKIVYGMVNIIIKAYQKTFREKLHLKCKTNLIDGTKKIPNRR